MNPESLVNPEKSRIHSTAFKQGVHLMHPSDESQNPRYIGDSENGTHVYMKHTSTWKSFKRRAAEHFGGIRSGAAPALTGTRADVRHLHTPIR